MAMSNCMQSMCCSVLLFFFVCQAQLIQTSAIQFILAASYCCYLVVRSSCNPPRSVDRLHTDSYGRDARAHPLLQGIRDPICRPVPTCRPTARELSRHAPPPQPSSHPPGTPKPTAAPPKPEVGRPWWSQRQTPVGRTSMVLSREVASTDSSSASKDALTCTKGKRAGGWAAWTTNEGRAHPPAAGLSVVLCRVGWGVEVWGALKEKRLGMV